MLKNFNLVEKQTKKRTIGSKKIHFLMKIKLEVGQCLMIFNTTRKVGEASKLKRIVVSSVQTN